MDKQEAAVKLQEKIDTATSALETAFQAMQEMKDASNEIYNEEEDWSHFDLEREGLVSLSKLKDLMDDNGWSSSGLWC